MHRSEFVLVVLKQDHTTSLASNRVDALGVWKTNATHCIEVPRMTESQQIWRVRHPYPNDNF